MIQDPTFWVLIAFVVFIGMLIHLNVPGMITAALDKRSAKIRADLDGSDTLLKEAQGLLATYQKKQREAADEAQEIKAKAREDAERIAEHGRERLDEKLKRHEALAVNRIAQAETAALDEIRARTIDIAIDATREILRSALSTNKINALIDNAIKELPRRLN